MKTLLVSLSIVLILSLGGLIGCGDSGIVAPIATPTISTPTVIPTIPTTGTVNGEVVDRDNDKIPNAYIAGNPFIATTNQEEVSKKTTEDYSIKFFADNNGNFQEALAAGTYELSAWPNIDQFNSEPDNPLCTFKITSQVGETTNTILRYGYFPKDCDPGFGSIYGQVFENASEIEGAYVEAYVVYEDQKIMVSQDNQFVSLTNIDGYYSLNDIPIKTNTETEAYEPTEVEVNMWLSRDDHNANFLNPKATYTVYVESQMKFWLEGQVGNMAGKK